MVGSYANHLITSAGERLISADSPENSRASAYSSAIVTLCPVDLGPKTKFWSTGTCVSERPFGHWNRSETCRKLLKRWSPSASLPSPLHAPLKKKLFTLSRIPSYLSPYRPSTNSWRGRAHLPAPSSPRSAARARPENHIRSPETFCALARGQKC